MLTDDEAATLAIQTFCPGSKLSEAQIKAKETISVALASPTPFIEDLDALFHAYDTLYFRSRLSSTTTVTWSTRMTSCAGICALLTDKATNLPLNPRQCSVRLSEPLLKFRPRSDSLDTLLHECIHAYLFIAGGRHVRGDDPTGHGSGFQRIAVAINDDGGYTITSTHTFHAEVESYQVHVWQCTGSCQELPPYFGIVRRAMNRAPGPSDSWYEEHKARCDGGVWVKIAGPPPKGKKKEEQKNKIEQWLVKGVDKLEDRKEENGGSPQDMRAIENGLVGASISNATALPDKYPPRRGDKDATLAVESYPRAPGTSEPGSAKKRRLSSSGTLMNFLQSKDVVSKKPKSAVTAVTQAKSSKRTLVECPVCPQKIPEDEVNSHLDGVHGF